MKFSAPALPKLLRSCHLQSIVVFVVGLLCSVALGQGDGGTATGAPGEIYNSEKEVGEPISAEDALNALNLPEGFDASLFASEPTVMNPIAACTDPMGRVWVAENYTYAERELKFDLNLSDRIVVLQDTDGDGVSDQRTVFADDLKILTGIVVGRGGVWAMTPPQLLFIPDADGDLVADGPPQVMLDGFVTPKENYHNFANGLSWGPDGWLYGRCGASAPGDVGLPGDVAEDRIPIRGGMWRYHPKTEMVEALVQGTTNPWGHDWNEAGDLFFINTVNGHFWHCISGAHFVRPHTLDVNPYSYELIDMHADHWHFDTGKSWTDSRDGAANDYGGGHAHIGMMIYQEATWPAEYQGRVMTVNMHGRRINQESLIRDGTGYTASHEKDFVMSDDEWFRGMELLPLPDGNVLMLDWSDTGECHDHTGVHRTSGRIFKIRWKESEKSGERLAGFDSATGPETLVELLSDAPEWHARKVRDLMASMALIAERGTRTEFGAESLERAATQLRESAADSSLSNGARLRAVWSLLAMGEQAKPLGAAWLSEQDETLRTWGVRLFVDQFSLDDAYGDRPRRQFSVARQSDVQRLVELAKSERSAKVRLELASALQRLPVEMRTVLAQELVRYSEDAADHNQPLMIWYGIAPLGTEDVGQLLKILEKCELPTVRRLIARRVAAGSKQDSVAFTDLFQIGARLGFDVQRDIVAGVQQGLAGWRKSERPATWSGFQASIKRSVAGLGLEEARQLTAELQKLNVLFGDGRTVEQLRKIAMDGKQSLELRKSALQSLVDSRTPDIKELCLQLLRTRFLNVVAASGLAGESDPSIGNKLIDSYRRFHPSERPQVISILTSRVPWAKSLLVAVGKKTIDRSEVSAFQARQIASLDDSQLGELLQEHWGQVRVSDEAKKRKIATLRSELTEDYLADADLSKGRALFQKNCSSCHQLFGEGGQLGPDLTGAQRSNIDYLLDNIVDPSAVVTKEFRATRILLEDDRVLTGLLTERSENVVTLATQNEVYRIPTDEIAAEQLSQQSTMPEGLLDSLDDGALKNLFGYLKSKKQVALPK